MNDFNKNNFFSFIDDVSQERRFFIKINKQMVEVQKDVYYVCYNSYRKELRDNKRDQLFGLLSFDAQLDDGFTLLDFLGSEDDLIERITYQERLSKVKNAFLSLTQDEQNLLKDLYIHEKTEREIADQYHVSRQMINKRKQKIIKKIKNLLKNGC